ncbi:fic family toxin-antitoxin system, toxin component [Streptomyces sp. NPDC001868]|uniref:fic family toxin-antitoxin system, toxin component n=1 Tax=Streptomyces sp. NPDC001868 TaxID=3154401 RepID=UPI00332CCD17
MLDAACARGQGRDVYASDWLKAAARLETITLHELLEENEFFAWLVAETYLSGNGITLDYEPEEALALVMRAKHKGARVQEVAAQLRVWSTS